MIQNILKRVGEFIAIFLVAGILISFFLSKNPDFYLQKSFGQRFVENLHVFFTFDYNHTISDGLPLFEVLFNRLGKSFILISGALFFAGLAGIGAGVACGLQKNNRFLKSIASILQGFSSIPMLVWGIMMIAFFQFVFHKLIYYDYIHTYGRNWVSAIYLGPILCLVFGDGLLADIIRSSREETAKIMEQPFITSLIARNIKLTKHVVRALMGPLFSAFAGRAVYLIGGTVIVEWVFNYKGLGYQILASLTYPGVKDYKMIMASTITFILISSFLHLLSEIVILLSDPRVQ